MLGMGCAKTKVVFLRRDSKFVNITWRYHIELSDGENQEVARAFTK